MTDSDGLLSFDNVPVAVSEETPAEEQPPSGRLFNATDKQWNDWHWQIRNRITSLERLAAIMPLSPTEMLWENRSLPFGITPYYTQLVAENDVLRKCMIPSVAETIVSPEEDEDPLSEERQSPVMGIVRRYPDRCLFLVTDFCSCNCRYCTRSRMVGRGGLKGGVRKIMWTRAIKWIEEHDEIRDVLVSGGDPLTLSDDNIEFILKSLRAIKHVEVIRIGTKAPVVLPQRITGKLVRMLKKYHPLYVNIHFTHPCELTPETVSACERLVDAGIPLGSQTVLLRGVNDDVDVMRRLMTGLMKARVRPYYIYQCDLIPGARHFRTPITKGLEIMQGLRGYISGLAVPSFIIDAPHGGGKIPLLPEYYRGRDEKGVYFKSYNGKDIFYPEPKEVREVYSCK